MFRDTPKGYVTQTLAGQRVAQVLIDPSFSSSGLHWSWGNGQVSDREAFAQRLSAKATQLSLGIRLWELSNNLVGIADEPEHLLKKQRARPCRAPLARSSIFHTH